MTPLTFRHEAFMYSSRAEFVAGAAPFVREGVDAGEPVLVVETREKIDMLRAALGEDTGRRVMFADMAAVGSNPALIIPAWRDFVDLHGAGGRPVRGIGEPIWSERTGAELVECQRHESLLNVAFAGGRPWYLLCPYDTTALDAAVIAEARRSHEYVREAGRPVASPEYRGLEASGAPFAAPLPPAPADARTFAFDRDRLLQLRGEVMRLAATSGLGAAAATHLVSAVNEVATNSIVHGGGKGTLRMWREPGVVVCEVSDTGSYRHALADRARPGRDPRAARGLWLANQLCDLVQIRSLPDATVVRLRMRRREPAPVHE